MVISVASLEVFHITSFCVVITVTVLVLGVFTLHHVLCG